MSPYATALTRAKSINRYFTKDGNRLIFIGDTLEVRIPKRFETHGVLEVGNQVRCPLIADLIFNNTERAALNIPTTVTTEPRAVSTMTYDGVEYLVMTYGKGDAFLPYTTVRRDGDLPYAMWVEFINNGGIPYWLSYDDRTWLFSRCADVSGYKIPANPAIIEMVQAHLHRLASNMSIPYRLTPATEPFVQIALKSVAWATDNATSRLIGSYHGDALDASLANPTTQSQRFEDILRGIPRDDPPGAQ